MKSYAVWCIFPSDPPATNALRFATRAEADAWGFDLLCRWTAPESYEIRESDDPVTHTIKDGKLERLEDAAL